jgi:hypothetical protein
LSRCSAKYLRPVLAGLRYSENARPEADLSGVNPLTLSRIVLWFNVEVVTAGQACRCPPDDAPRLILEYVPLASAHNGGVPRASIHPPPASEYVWGRLPGRPPSARI